MVLEGDQNKEVINLLESNNIKHIMEREYDNKCTDLIASLTY